MKKLIVHPSPILQGEITVPGDKSISHRAVMLSALAKGKSILRGMLLGEDVLSTIGCFRQMGVPINILEDRVEVQGVGLLGLKAPQAVLDCGNSGTTLRLMMGLLSGQHFVSRLTGDASLNRRPVERVAKPLRMMGAEIEELRASDTERVVKITGRPLRGIRYELPVASAQVKSAILLAGLYAQGETRVIEKIPSRNHSEIMLAYQKAPLSQQGLEISISSPKQLQALDLKIPGDISSAAFFLVAGLIGQSSKIRLNNVGVNPTRTGILEVLQNMGAKIQILSKEQAGGEEVATLEVQSSSLQGTSIAGNIIPRLIDEIPILSVAAATAEGVTEISDASELRVKESDRIEAICRELSKAKIKVKSKEDGLTIEGRNDFNSGIFQSGSDHRIAMSMAIWATQASKSSTIEDVGCIDTSYPQFFDHLKKIGVKFEQINDKSP